jgi:hypothetical protein
MEDDMALAQHIDARFAVQQIDHGSWKRATAANLATDYYFGHKDVVEQFLASPAGLEFAGLRKDLSSWSAEELSSFVEREKKRSLLFLVMMLTGACNADCEICFTDRRAKRGETTPDDRTEILRQARALGARFVYVPGEGEPTIDKGFWAFLEACRESRLEAVVFTNGMVLSSDEQCQKYWKMSVDEAVARLVEYPVNFYVKWWTTKPSLAHEMLRVQAKQLPYTKCEGIEMPVALATLFENFPRHRLGIETVFESRNAGDVEEEILPFSQQYGLARILEMLQHNGRMLGDGRFDPGADASERIAPYLSVTSCSMASVKAVVTSRGYLSPRIAVLENQIPGEPCRVSGRDLFSSLHETKYVVDRRYDLATCLCETMAAALAPEMKNTVQTPMANVPPPSWVVGAPGKNGTPCGSNCTCVGEQKGAHDHHDHGTNAIA